MSNSVSPSEVTYQVLVNQEGQYSIWPAAKALPEGWTGAGKQGPKDTCLAYISEVWTDMRPLSLRRQMESTSAH
jgi:MbtH protein